LSSLEPFPFLDNTDTSLDRRARAYLHENCGYCHRPNGPGQGPMDFRFEECDAAWAFAEQPEL
jgi:hypothetical protein